MVAGVWGIAQSIAGDVAGSPSKDGSHFLGRYGASSELGPPRKVIEKEAIEFGSR
jgi:hypothetical protein